MDLVDEKHVARFKSGQKRGQVAHAGQDRAGGGAEIDAQFARDDAREGGLAEAGRREQDMIERLFARARGLDETRG